MPIHYAISDGLVALIGAWGAWRLVKSGQLMAALGITLFGVAGAIGAVRFTSGLIDPLADVHRYASQIGGLAGLCLILSQVFRMTGRLVSSVSSIVGATAIAGTAIIAPAAGAFFFIAGLVGGMLLLWLGVGPEYRNIRGAIGFGVMLPNLLFVRKSVFLAADLSWHLYHVVVALWLAIIVHVLLAKPVGKIITMSYLSRT